MKKTMPLPTYVKSAIKKLNAEGYEAYVVGGAVRSWLLEKDVHDYDITTNALPLQIKETFADKKTIDTGLRHGTVTILDKKHTVEITTYRIETTYSDHRHPDSVTFTGALKEDCARRDFTVNALCYHPKEGIIDFFSGLDDLQNGLIRAVGDPEKRFNEDALRIVRAVRFSAQLGFTIEPLTRRALLEKLSSLRYVSQERITAELVKMLEAPHLDLVLEDYHPLFLQIIEELREYQEPRWAGMVLDMSRCENNARTRMALLLDGLNDAARSDEILRRLKYSNSERYMIINLLENKNLPLENRTDLRKALNRLSVPSPEYIDFRCARDTRLNRQELLDLYQKIIHDNDCYTFKQLELTGHDLKALNLKGPQISAAMNASLYAVMEDMIPNEKEAIINYLKNLYGI